MKIGLDLNVTQDMESWYQLAEDLILSYGVQSQYYLKVW